jgi:hypothetical protein
MNARIRKRGGGGVGDDTSRSKWGKGSKVAAGSLAATVVGAVVRDLSRPNSLILGLISTARHKLLARRETRAALDIGEAVEVEIADDRTTKRDIEKDKNNQQEV